MSDLSSAIAREAREAFACDGLMPPQTSLRAANAIDDYGSPPPYDERLDLPTDEYLEQNYWGISHLNAASFRHYVPRLLEYTLQHAECGSNVGEAFIAALRPPDRVPPRLASLSQQQEEVLVRFLDILAFSSLSRHQESAQLALEEWWAPGALYRQRNDA